MATRPPRVTSTRRQPTTRPVPRITSRYPQTTSGRGRLTRQPSVGLALTPWGGRGPALNTGGRTVSAGGVPASTVAAPQYSTSNLPPDASYDQAVALLQRQRDEGIAGIVGERSRTLSDYGFQEGPSGALTFDVNNPFSKAALMKKTFDTNRRSTGQSMASGGQQYSGAFQNAQDLVNRNQLQSEDALQKNLAAFLARNTGQQKEAGTNYEIAAGQAYGDRLSRFQSNPLYDPAASDGSAAGGVPAAMTAAAAAASPQTLASIAAGLRRRARLTGAKFGRI